MTSKKLAILVVATTILVITFFILRTISLNNLPVFVDEAIYVRWSQVMRSEASLRFLPMSDGKQPLFMWVTMPFLKIFSDPLIAGRMVSVLSGFGTMIGIVILAYLLYSSFFVSFLAGVIYTVVPFAVFFNRMALADSMLAMFGVWVLVFGYLFSKTLRLDYAMLTGFAMGGGLLTKSPAIFFYAWILISILFFANLKDFKKNTPRFGQLILGLVAIFLISQTMNSILKLGPNSNMAGLRNQDYLYSFKEVLAHPFSPLIPNLKTTTKWLWLLLTPAVFLSIFMFDKEKMYRKKLLFLFTLSLLPLLVQASMAKVYTSRYILFTIIPLVIIAAKNLSKINRFLVAFFLLVPTLLSLKYIYMPSKVNMPFDMVTGYYQDWTSGWGQKDIANYLIEKHNQGKKIVVFTEGFFGTLPDGLQIYTQSYSNLTVVGSTPIAEVIPDGLVKTSLDNERYFVINKSRNKLPESELAKLELIREYPKLMREDGTREYLQFYKLK